MTVSRKTGSKTQHTTARVIGRAIIGRPLDGTRRTNSTFFRPASEDLTEHQRSASWHWRPGWHRSAARLGTVAGTAGALYGYATAPGWLLLGASLVALAAGMYVTVRGVILARLWSHRRHVIYPLWHIIANMTGYPVNNPAAYQSTPKQQAGHSKYHKRERPEKFLHIPLDYSGNEKAVIRWEPPFTWEGNPMQQRAITGVFERKLGGDWAADWHLHHDEKQPGPRFLLMRHAPQPPARVTFAEFQRMMEQAAENILRLGYGTGGALADIDLDSESPHVAISMGTGGGKTDTIAGVIAALVRKGCERIDIIDPKRVSHNWARDLPGVHIHKYVTAQMKAIRDARILMDARYDALDADDTVTFNRHVLIIEEQNSLMLDLKEHWDDYRATLEPKERASTSKQNPAIKDLRYILNKGRQCRINVISIYQRMSADAAGGGDARENYGAKIIARYSPQTWKILVGTPFIRPSRIPGRAMLVLGEDSHAIQRVYAGIADSTGKPDLDGIAKLRAWALNGREDIRVTGGERLVPEMLATPQEAVSLREACDTGILNMKHGAAVKARQRDKTFPEGVPGSNGTVYEPDALITWQANRVDKRVAA